MATDAFTDDDGTGLETHDANWTSVHATYPVTNLEINSNIVEHEGAWQKSSAYYDGSSEDCSEILIKARTAVGFAHGHVCVRMAADHVGYSLSIGTADNGNVDDCFVGKDGAWLATLEAAGNWPIANNHTLKITASGTTTVTIEGFVDGVSQGSTQDSSSPLGTGHPGFYQEEEGAVVNSRFDDWTDCAAAGWTGKVIGVNNPIKVLGTDIAKVIGV